MCEVMVIWMSKWWRSSDSVCPSLGSEVTVQQVVDIFVRPIDYIYLILLYSDSTVQGNSVEKCCLLIPWRVTDTSQETAPLER